MKALIVIDVQNEFSPKGKRLVSEHAAVIEAIRTTGTPSNINGIARLMEIWSMTR